ncbi:MAG: zinc ribbon domain-containing protein [Clostridia bacterium]|nr:zinc ribbon domain-containing protein [Clostridia bacterium]
MSNLSDQVSYLRGLAEGLKLDTETNEGKLIDKMLELLTDMAQELDELRNDHDDLSEFVESIDADLGDIEDILYDEDEDDDEDEDEDDEDEENDNLVEYTCPHCGEEMTFEVDSFDFDEDYLCPNCHQPLFPETPDEDDEDE